VKLGYEIENILTPEQNHLPSVLGAPCKWYSFHTDKATWISLRESPASRRIFPCLSSTAHHGIALKEKRKILPNSEDHKT